MEYSDFVEEVTSGLEELEVEVANLDYSVDSRIDDLINSGVVGDPDAEIDEEEFDDGDVDMAVDAIHTEVA
tara:strand:+ start:4655 stop:4867 length:213 start_codon:yes stop_codon:yes gene_type:complete